MLPPWWKQVCDPLFLDFKRPLKHKDTTNSSDFGVPLLLPAPRFGAYECDTPWNLANAIMHAVGPLTGTASGENGGGEGDTFIRLALHHVANIAFREQQSFHDLHW